MLTLLPLPTLLAVVFDPTITLGTVLQMATMVITVIIAVVKLLERIGNLQTTLEHHGARLEEHDEAIKALMVQGQQMMGTVQRLIGRSEVAERANRHH